MSVILETTLGDIIVDLFVNERPRTCFNFLKLCKIKFYNYCLFHKVEKDFTAQTGDPESTGRGGESIFSHLYGDQAKYFEAETKPRLKHVNLGTLSMINNGQNMHGSQFFITLAEDLDFLDGEHTVFGQVEEGLETLQKINESICDEHHRPYQDIRISHTIILEDPYDDPPGLKIPDASPELTEEQIRSSGRIGADEEIDDTKGKSMEEIEEEIQDKEAKARATILEMVGDIPDAEVRPPDNVLFVCKLNPVTTSDDLEVIFSRFGTIVSCEVIKDKKTGESLQYAFIEFDKEEDCENAYFKMDNVLIDDRRIHVDFSQSVAKLNYQEMKQHAKNLMGLKVKDRALPNRSAQTGKKYDLVFEDEAPASNAAYKDLKKHIKEEEKRVKHSKKESKKSRRHSRSKSSSSERKKSGRRNPRDRREDEPLHRDRREDRSLIHRDRREDRSHLHRDRREDKPRNSGPVSKRYEDRGRNEKDSTHHRREAKPRGYVRSRSSDSGSEVERRDRRRRDDRRPRDNSRK